MLQKMRGSAPVKLLVLGAVVVLFIGVMVIPGLFSSGRASNDRRTHAALKVLASAEADFRGNDRDWNHENDFWTADVKGLYTMKSSAVAGATPNSTSDPSIRLIDLSTAAADADETFYSAGGENVPLSEFALTSAKAGYWFAALRADLSTTPPTAYARHAQGKAVMEQVRHESKFGFLMFPDSLAAARYVYIVNEGNTVYRAPATVPCRSSGTLPPGVRGIPAAYLNWPDEKTMKAHWTMLD
jgi:hypothetical protein